MAGIDWSRVTFTEHMTEAAAVVGTCRVVLDFGSVERAAYEITICETLKGATGGGRYFAIGTNAEEPAGYRPVGGGDTPEAALDACLRAAGIHHRRRVKQADE